MKLHLTLFALLIISVTGFSQGDFGVKINCGVSRISNTFAEKITGYKIQLTPSGNAGLYYNYHLGEKSVLGTELLFNQIEGREGNEMIFSDETGNEIGSGSVKFHSHISYLSLPIYCGMKFNKLTVNIGLQGSFYLFSSWTYISESMINGEPVDIYMEPQEMHVDTYNVGTRLGMAYQLNDRISIDGSYYFGLNNINGDDNKYERKIQQLTFGIRYSFI